MQRTPDEEIIYLTISGFRDLQQRSARESRTAHWPTLRQPSFSE
ncbi:MAG: hypothetical protein R2849_18090 [Thermomicrobiales bacterium]